MLQNKRNRIIMLAAAAVVLAVLVLAFLQCKQREIIENKEITTKETAAAEESAAQNTAISIGGAEYSPETESLCPEGTDYSALASALGRFTALKTLDLRKLELSDDEILSIVNMLPDTEVVYDVEILGRTYSQNEDSIDLSDMKEEDTKTVASSLRLFRQLTSVTLPEENGEESLSFNAIAQLREAAPQTSFDYEFTLFGKTLTLEDTEISFADKKIGNEGVEVFYELIPCMPGLERLVLDDCGVDNEVMAELRDAFPEVSVVWRVYWSSFSALTDTVSIRSTGLSIKSADALKYCTEARFVDLGHSESLENIDFAAYMPKLQLLIVADSAITSIEPLANCGELLMLEVVNCWRLTGIDALSNCKKLRYLNLSNAYEVKDLSPLYDLPALERVYASRYEVPESQVEKLKELHPDCWISFGMPEASLVSCNYSIGWRLDAAPKVMAEWYVELRKIFGIGYNLYSSDGYYNYKRAKPYQIPLDELKIFVMD